MYNPANLPALGTVAELKAILTSLTPQYPYVHVAENSAVYEWDAGSTETSNDWTVVNPTDNGGDGRWLRINPVPEALVGTAVVNLKSWMDIYYGKGQWSYWGGAHTGTDCGPAIDAACLWLKNNQGGYGVLYVPGGPSFRLVTPPTELSGVLIQGDTIFSSQFIFDNDSDPCFRWTGAGGYTGGGIRNIAIYIEQDHDTSSAIAIFLSGDATFQPDQFTIDNIYVTALGSSYWGGGFEIEATARTAPQGCRIGTINNYQQFRCSVYSFQFRNAVQWTCDNLGAYVPKAATVGDTLIVSGGGSNLTNTTQLHINGSLFGLLSCQNAKNCTINNSLVGGVDGDTTFKTYIVNILCASPPSNPWNVTAGSFIYNVLQTL